MEYESQPKTSRIQSKGNAGTLKESQVRAMDAESDNCQVVK